MSALSFTIEERAPLCGARAGSLATPHGVIRTPAFTSVGTKANVKGILPGALRALGADVVLANTYHLYLQPGESIVRDAGGLGKFMGWAGPTMTDSGGFQVFSLGAAFGKTISKFTTKNAPQEESVAVYDESVASQHGRLAIIDDEGVSFTSHLDGSRRFLSPEIAVEVQGKLGADIQMQLDVCPPGDSPRDVVEAAVKQTTRWAKRALATPRLNSSSRPGTEARPRSPASQLPGGPLNRAWVRPCALRRARMSAAW